MAGEGAGRCGVGGILAGDMNHIWRLGLAQWDGRWGSPRLEVLFGVLGNNT